jgi:hypothetical protein
MYKNTAPMVSTNISEDVFRDMAQKGPLVIWGCASQTDWCVHLDSLKFKKHKHNEEARNQIVYK